MNWLHGLWRHLIGSCILLGALGCALHDYEEHIDAQQARLKILDEEDRNLGESIDVPKIKGKDNAQIPVWPFDVFLRLPKDLPGTIKEESHYDYLDLPLYRYSGGREGYCVLIAAGLVADKKDKEKDKGKDKDKGKADDKGRPDDKGKDAKPRPSEWPSEVFRDRVRSALMEYYRKEYKIIPDFPSFDRKKFEKMSKLPISARGDVLPPIDFEAMAFKDDFNKTAKETSLFQAYFYQHDNKQMAIIIQSPLAWKDDQAQVVAVDWSLKSLEIGPAAAAKTSAFYKGRRFKR